MVHRYYATLSNYGHIASQFGKYSPNYKRSYYADTKINCRLRI